MINTPIGLTDSEMSLYIAAFERCTENIKSRIIKLLLRRP